jgi:hypothetical protein
MGHQFTIPDGFALFVVSTIISLAVFAINSKINASTLLNQLAMANLELKLEKEYIKPLRDEIQSGFQSVYAILEKRRESDK